MNLKRWVETRRIPLVCALIAVTVGFIAAGNIMTSYEFRTSSLVRMGFADDIAEKALETDPNFVLYAGDSHYDGIYFYAIARDPIAVGEEHELIDLPGARYGHPLFGWVAGILSLGNPDFIPPALLLLNLASIGLLAAAVSRLSEELGWSPWAGLMVAMNPGLIYAMTVDTSEVFGNCLLALALLAWFRNRLGIATALLIALCFAKEQYVLVLASLWLWEFVRLRRGQPAPDMWRRLGLLSIGPVALFLWNVYLRATFGYWAFEDYGNTTFPLIGWAQTLVMSAVSNDGFDFNQYQIESAVAPVLLALGSAMVAAAMFAGRLRTPIDLIVIFMVLLNFSLTWLNLFYLKDLIRQMSTLFLLLPAAFAGVRAGAPYLKRLGLRPAPGATVET